MFYGVSFLLYQRRSREILRQEARAQTDAQSWEQGCGNYRSLLCEIIDEVENLMEYIQMPRANKGEVYQQLRGIRNEINMNL